MLIELGGVVFIAYLIINFVLSTKSSLVQATIEFTNAPMLYSTNRKTQVVQSQIFHLI